MVSLLSTPFLTAVIHWVSSFRKRPALYHLFTQVWFMRRSPFGLVNLHTYTYSNDQFPHVLQSSPISHPILPRMFSVSLQTFCHFLAQIIWLNKWSHMWDWSKLLRTWVTFCLLLFLVLHLWREKWNDHKPNTFEELETLILCVCRPIAILKLKDVRDYKWTITNLPGAERWRFWLSIVAANTLDIWLRERYIEQPTIWCTDDQGVIIGKGRIERVKHLGSRLKRINPIRLAGRDWPDLRKRRLKTRAVMVQYRCQCHFYSWKISISV